MTSICVCDFESFYSRDFSLSKMTTEAYVRDPRFQTIGCAFKWDDGVTHWVPSQDRVADYIKSRDWSEVLVVCQNTAFDGAIMAWHYGINPLGWIDIMGMSRALFPHEKSHSLKSQAVRMGIGEKGTEVENAMGKRYEDFTTVELARYGEYCKNDVELTYTLFHKYMAMGFPKQELKLIDMTIRMFTEPKLILDKPMLETHLKDVREQKLATLEAVRDRLLEGGDAEATNAVFSEGLDGIKKLLMSNEKFAEALRAVGVEPPMKVSPTTGKMAYAFAKSDEAFKALEEHDDPQVQALVCARLSNKTTLEETRTETLLGYADRGLFPIALRYYGAHTGRWSAESSAKVNMQNLPRSSPLKKAIKAPEGYVLCGADLSNIELRLGLWLAEQDDRVQMLADGRDLYKDFAADVYNVGYDEVTKPQRQVGKVSNLSLIYGTGGPKLREALRIMGGVKVSLEEAKPIVDLYRQRNKKVTKAWEQGEMALRVMANGQTMPLFRNGICTVEGSKGIRLPSGLYLSYPNLRRVTKEDGKGAWVFDGKNHAEHIYGAKVFQGATQAVARCIMADGMRKLEKRYPACLTIHDSAYWLALIAEAEEALAFGIAAITAPVKYCPGLPLAAEGAYGPSLADC